jgi:CRP/FNR family transcriptional regulator
MIERAITGSLLARLPAGLRERLAPRDAMIELGSRTYFMREGEAPRIGLVVSGLLRCFRATADGDELTLIWGRPGALIGVAGMVQPPSPWSFQAVTDSTVLELPIATWTHLMHTDVAVALVIASQYDQLLRRAVDEIVLYAHGDLRRRVVLRLLELASRGQPAGPLVAPITQEDLAQAVGATRPSVARVLKQLRDEGAVRSMYGGILVERPEALAAEL